MVNKLTCEEEVFYRRLLNVVDDYGRFYANPSLLLAACYPLKLDTVNISDIEKWLKALVDVRGIPEDKIGLIIVYKARGTKYLQVVNFKQQLRTPSKFPEPPDINCYANDEQMHSKCIANDHVSVSVSEGVVEGEGEGVFEYGAPKNTGVKSTGSFFCKRNGKKVPADKHGSYVLLTHGEYQQMVCEWGKRFADAAVAEYDQRYPNSKAIRGHTDHNRAIRDYVNRGYLCQGMTPRPAPTNPQTPKKNETMEVATPEEIAKIFHPDKPELRNGKGPQPIGEILNEMSGGP